jgi:hypothetical protein
MNRSISDMRFTTPVLQTCLAVAILFFLPSDSERTPFGRQALVSIGLAKIQRQFGFAGIKVADDFGCLVTLASSLQ